MTEKKFTVFNFYCNNRLRYLSLQAFKILITPLSILIFIKRNLAKKKNQGFNLINFSTNLSG